MAYQGSKQSINQASKKTDFTADLAHMVGLAKARPIIFQISDSQQFENFAI